jgi:Fe-S cluster assembly iron-binding protein IscA
LLTVTETAAIAMRSALAHADVPESSGIRISAGADPSSNSSERPGLRLEIVPDKQPGDEQVTATGGPPIFIDAVAVPLVDDKVLDGDIDADGRAVFKIVSATAP